MRANTLPIAAQRAIALAFALAVGRAVSAGAIDANELRLSATSATPAATSSGKLASDAPLALLVGDPASGRLMLIAESAAADARGTFLLDVTFDFAAQDTLYIVARGSAVLGEFQAGGVAFRTGESAWQAAALASAARPDAYACVAQAVARGRWSAVREVGPNGVAPWGAVKAIDASARWMSAPQQDVDAAGAGAVTTVYRICPATAWPEYTFEGTTNLGIPTSEIAHQEMGRRAGPAPYAAVGGTDSQPRSLPGNGLSDTPHFGNPFDSLPTPLVPRARLPQPEERPGRPPSEPKLLPPKDHNGPNRPDPPDTPDPPDIPEPATALLLATGAMLVRRRR